jgi:hypothetical protein
MAKKKENVKTFEYEEEVNSAQEPEIDEVEEETEVEEVQKKPKEEQKEENEIDANSSGLNLDWGEVITFF